MKKFLMYILIVLVSFIGGYLIQKNISINNQVEFLKNKDTSEEISIFIEEPSLDENGFEYYIRENPIDKYFLEELEKRSNSPSSGYLIEEYYNAWNNEIKYATEKLKLLLDEKDYELVVNANEDWEKYMVNYINYQGSILLPGARSTEFLYKDINGEEIGANMYRKIIADLKEQKTKERAIELLRDVYNFTYTVEFKFNPEDLKIN